MAAAEVRRLARIGVNVADLDAACGFYVSALGFTHESTRRLEGSAFAAPTGLPGARAAAASLRLGEQIIELTAFDPPGAPYPEPRHACDPWFQHMAIVVADMPAAYARLAACAMTPISDGGPQLLPPSTGGITAFKFRDPEGHPLELSFFPDAVAAPQWRTPAPGSLCLGIDHSAIAVADLARSEAFWVDGLGFEVGARLVNRGPTQARLDGLADPVVDIVTLHAADPTSPHLELLHYRGRETRAGAWNSRADDVAATRLEFEVEGLDALLGRLPGEAGAEPQVDGSRRAMLRDPDGHRLVLREWPAPT